MSNNTSTILLRPARGLPAYLHHLLRISTVQICRESGYRQSSHTALDTLTALLHHLIRELGLTARHYAELSGRSDVNLIDLLHALDDYQYDINTLIDYHTHSDQLPFPRTLPNFPTPRPVTRVEPVSGGVEDAGGRERRPAHIPPYLPRWPEERTYRHTDVKASNELTNTDKRHRRMEQNRAVEQALLRIQQAERQPAPSSTTDNTDTTTTTSPHKRHRADDSRDSHLNDPATHQPIPAPPPPFPHRERERERTLSKNPYLAPLAPPQPPPQSPPPASDTAAAAAMEAGSGGGSEKVKVEGGSSGQIGWAGGGGGEGGDVDIGDTFASNPPPPRTAGSGSVSRPSQPAAPPPVTDENGDVEIEI